MATGKRRLFLPAAWTAACLAAGIARTAASQSPVSVDLDVASVQRSLDQGAYDAAEREARVLADRLEKEEESPLERLRAQDLLVDALIRNGKASAPGTLALAERVVSSKEQLFHRDDLEIATSLHLLGAVHTERGEFSASIPIHERALSIRQKTLHPNDPAVADSLDYLALPLIRLQRFADARERESQP